MFLIVSARMDTNLYSMDTNTNTIFKEGKKHTIQLKSTEMIDNGIGTIYQYYFNKLSIVKSCGYNIVHYPEENYYLLCIYFLTMYPMNINPIEIFTNVRNAVLHTVTTLENGIINLDV